MPSSFKGSDKAGGDSPDGSIEQFNDDHVGQDQSPELSSFSNFDDFESIKHSAAEDFQVFTSRSLLDSPSVLPIYESSGGFYSKTMNFSQDGYVNAVESSYDAMDDPILPPPAEMLPEEGYALREWRRQNAIRLKEKEKIEKESLIQIMDEAEEYKIEFYKKSEVSCAANKSLKRDNEKLFVSSLEKFHAEADKSYWKAIAELIPNEVPKIEKRGKKEQDNNNNNKPSVVVVQGPKPGKPSDLSRMHQILVKLKHNPPTHLTQSSPVEPMEAKPESAIAAV